MSSLDSQPLHDFIETYDTPQVWKDNICESIISFFETQISPKFEIRFGEPIPPGYRFGDPIQFVRQGNPLPVSPSKSSGLKFFNKNRQRICTTLGLNFSVELEINELVYAFVKTAIDNLSDSAPAALDTLNEIAAALNDSPAQINDILTKLGEKAVKSNNLSDLTNAATARTNLGINNTPTGAQSFATSQVTSGTFTDARIAQSNVTQHQKSLSLSPSQVGLANVTNESKATMFSSPAFTGDVSIAANGLC